MAIPEDCIELHSKPLFTIKEHRSEVKFLNPDRLEIHQWQIDGCIFKDNDQKRCDWLINVHEISKSIFVELKGSDIEHAFDQISQTQQSLPDLIKSHIVWIISFSGNPRFSTSIQNLTLKARRDFKGAILRIERTPCSYRL